MQSTVFPVSLMHSLFKTISWVQLLYWLNEFSLLEDSSVGWKFFQDHLTSKTVIWPQSALSPGRLQEWICLSICTYLSIYLYMISMVMWCLWHWHQHHMIPMVSSLTPPNSLSQNNWNECNMTFLVMWFHWHWHQNHNSNGTIELGLDDQGWAHDFFGHMMPLPLAFVSYDAEGVINSTIAFLGSRWLK